MIDSVAYALMAMSETWGRTTRIAWVAVGQDAPWLGQAWEMPRDWRDQVEAAGDYHSPPSLSVMKEQMMSEWQDIATATKDGSEILVSDGYEVNIAKWGDLYVMPNSHGWVPKRGDPGSSLRGITMWMPLPFLPTTPVKG